MESEAAAEATAIAKHKKFMLVGNKKRYVEVLQCANDDLFMMSNNSLVPSTFLTAPGAQPGLLHNHQIVTASNKLQLLLDIFYVCIANVNN